MTYKHFGLTSAQVQESLTKNGNNSLTQPPKETFLHKLWLNFQDPIIRILIFALLINIVFVYTGHGDWIETAGIFLAIILATFVSTYSEYSNESAFQKLQEEASLISCKVWRDGAPTEVHIDDIVVADAIILQAGDKIPVDGILLDGEIKVDQATLNGESEEANKQIAPKDFAWGVGNIDFLDANKLFRGSVVVEGQGVMRAIDIGDSSVYGKLTQELKDDERDSPLKVKLTELAGQISKVGYSVGVLIVLAVMLHNIFSAPSVGAYFADVPGLLQDLVQAAILGIIIIVMAVPEGLPLMIAVVSSLNMKKMLRDNVLVRKLAGIETAGSLNLLYTDKTGTITKGKLEVVDFLIGDGTTFPSFGNLPDKIKELTFANCLLNTSAAVADGKVIGGNMTEVALSNYLSGYNVDLNLEKIRFIPFNSFNKYSLAHVRGSYDFCLIKGAPDKLINYAQEYFDAAGNLCPLTAELKLTLDKKMITFAENSIRMLGLFTYPQSFEGDKLPGEGLRLIGVACIRDDVRPEAIEAIGEVQNAGVQVVMITGDRKETAMAIAKDAGIFRESTDIVWTSDELAALSDEEVKKYIPDLRVVARALPMDKSRLVRLSQELGLVVGMTGDGVNDSPALKKADVGFAMGSGTEVAKEAGDIVILDDNFLSIKKAILYGRTIYNSICKFITFQLTINFSAVAINLIAPFIGIARPLTITQILWINLIMDTMAALAFGGEPALAEYLKEKPKNRQAPIISREMAINILLAGAYMTFIAILFFKSTTIDHWFRNAPDHIYTYTGFFCVYVFMAVFNAFNVRVNSMNLLKNINRNVGFLQIMALIVIVQLVLTFIGGKVLRMTPLTKVEWIIVVAMSFSMVIVDLMRKFVFKKLEKGRKYIV
ncbi:MAG: calcium-translocating P-type ATPase, PMCA-type [Acidaminococcaceae bacterium]|nr:calcium-translocating P-type ATPase, PMCA-type [Acidaminococcaceae bacterium]MDD4721509.1 calcium-translocating P-type ATPase, PMCA-type [Acidaminococcaceae bacterium]